MMARMVTCARARSLDRHRSKVQENLMSAYENTIGWGVAAKRC